MRKASLSRHDFAFQIKIAPDLTCRDRRVYVIYPTISFKEAQLKKGRDMLFF